MTTATQYPIRVEGDTGKAHPSLIPSDPNKADLSGGKVPIEQLPVGTSSTTVAAGNDSRLSDARTPTAHASSHAAGGSDAIAVAESQLSLADNTTGNVSSSKHGFAPKAPNDASKYLDGSGAWSTPPSGSGSLSTIYSVDFTGLAAQNLLTGGDGAKTIGSKTWNLVNSANLQTAYLNDGTHAGLYLRCNANNSNNYDTTLTGGALWTRLPSLASGLAAQNWSTLWLMYMFSTPHVPNAQYEAAHFDMFYGTAYGVSSMVRIDGNLSYNTNLSFVASLTPPSSSSSYGSSDTTHTSYDVVALKVVSNTVGVYIGQSSGGAFPSVANLILLGIATTSSTTVLPMLSYEWAASFSVRSGNTTGAADLLLKKMQVLTM